MFDLQRDIWTGPYTSVSEAMSRCTPNGDQSAFWLEKCYRRISVARNGSEQEKASDLPEWNYSALDVAVGVALGSGMSASLRVVDVGGNLGQLRWLMQTRLPNTDLEWDIVESESFVAAARETYATYQEIQVHTSTAAIRGACDIIHFGSSIQYFEDLQTDIVPLIRETRPAAVALSDAMIGESIPSFIAVQKYHDTQLLCRFYALTDVVKLFDDLGYRLIFKKPHLSSDSSRYFPPLSLPVEYRIPFSLNLTFAQVTHC